MGRKVCRSARLTIYPAPSPKGQAQWVFIAIWIGRLMAENGGTGMLMGTAQSVRSTS